ncbi:CobW family GTP-binding protein [Pseudodesulfovibrio portus]|uniref:P47K family cobalamin synthesis protein n=1 Tax=Pseudodesulfovibrio portus TaxID=231439 RepID=A0ABM8ATT9_9BACT|nr:GTP-binding protein [Pseudodesulfovibrio portus]BDQ34847.1 P47K family cobalamin synthesis protein [Pseudodesulfovibrio portus]
MHGRLNTLLPPALLDNPVQAAVELPRALITRANFIPGVRHRLGWRGVRDCAKGKGGLTAKVTGMTGVFGLYLLNAMDQGGAGLATMGIVYFPDPEEELVESFSIEAGIAAQAPDYLDRVREFTLYDDLRSLFTVAVVEIHFSPEGPGVSLALTAPERDTVTALDGVTVTTQNGPVQAVAPGGTDQDLPALDTALPFFESLAASASYCMGHGPQSLSRSSRPGMRRVYGGDAGMKSEPAPDGRDVRFGLGWNMAVPDNPDMSVPDLAWNAPDPLPAEFDGAPWLTGDIPGAANSLDKRTMGITEKPRLILLTGFLGSGKTTFLARFIEEQAGRNGFVAVVQNEIGQKGLDGKLLGQHYAVTEVDEGCVCCTLAGSLRAALTGILSEFQPDFVVLETTGLANPANLLSEIADLDDMLEFASVTTVLDAACGLRALTDHEVARSQVRLADILLLNKTDLADGDALGELETRIRDLNPTADIHRTTHGNVPSTALYGVNFRKRLNRPAPFLPPMGGHHATHEDDSIQSALIDFESPLDRQSFRDGVAGLPDDVLRAKGVVRFTDAAAPEVFQYVPGHHDLTPAEDAGDCFVVIIGRNAERIAGAFRSAVGA